MRSPAANEGHVSKPPEKHLSEALRETLQNLNIKDVTPAVIINRFNKSGGIDRVRRAVENKMKDFTESQNRRTLAVSEEFLNEELSQGNKTPPRQKLMQQTQDVVLATVKDRIGRDVDSVTEQGKAAWFFECVRNELINVCKMDETTKKVEDEPAPPTKLVDGAKAILQNLTRNVTRARQANHAHDATKLNKNKEQPPANGHTDAAMNGNLSHDEKNKAATKGSHSPSQTVNADQMKESPAEDSPRNDQTGSDQKGRNQMESKVHPRSSAEDRSSSGQTLSAENIEQQLGTQSEPVAAESIQHVKDEKDYDALADAILGGSDDENTEPREAVSAEKSFPHSSAEAECTSDQKLEPQTGKTTSPEKERLPKPPEVPMQNSRIVEISNEATKTETPLQPKASEPEGNKALCDVSAPKSPEVSNMEVEEKSAAEDVQMAGEGTTTPAQEIFGDGKLQDDGIKAESATKERQSASKVSQKPRETAEQAKVDAEKDITMKETKRAGEDRREKEGDMVSQEKQTKSEDVPKRATEEAGGMASDFKMTETKEEKDKPTSSTTEETSGKIPDVKVTEEKGEEKEKPTSSPKRNTEEVRDRDADVEMTEAKEEEKERPTSSPKRTTEETGDRSSDVKLAEAKEEERKKPALSTTKEPADKAPDVRMTEEKGEEKEKPTSSPKGTTEEARDRASDVKMTEAQEEENEKPTSPTTEEIVGNASDVKMAQEKDEEKEKPVSSPKGTTEETRGRASDFKVSEAKEEEKQKPTYSPNGTTEEIGDKAPDVRMTEEKGEEKEKPTSSPKRTTEEARNRASDVKVTEAKKEGKEKPTCSPKGTIEETRDRPSDDKMSEAEEGEKEKPTSSPKGTTEEVRDRASDVKMTEANEEKKEKPTSSPKGTTEKTRDRPSDDKMTEAEEGEKEKPTSSPKGTTEETRDRPSDVKVTEANEEEKEKPTSSPKGATEETRDRPSDDKMTEAEEGEKEKPTSSPKGTTEETRDRPSDDKMTDAEKGEKEKPTSSPKGTTEETRDRPSDVKVTEAKEKEKEKPASSPKGTTEETRGRPSDDKMTEAKEEEKEKPTSSPKGTTEEVRDRASDVKMTEANEEEEESPTSSPKEQAKVTEEQTKSHHRKDVLPSCAPSGAKETTETVAAEEDQHPTSDKEEIPNSGGNEEVGKSNQDKKPSHSDIDSRLRSATDVAHTAKVVAHTATRRTTSPTWRASGRLPSTTKPKSEAAASESKKPAQETGAQKAPKATILRKEKRSRGRLRRKANESIDVRTEGKGKTMKGDSTRNRKEAHEKKRRRGHTTDDRISIQTQPSADRPDPAAENWPRGYDVDKSCVPEDFEAQQKVLHVLDVILEKEYAEPFSEPVNTSEKGLEMYSSVIKNPMDLGEIRKRLQSSSAERGYYLNLSEVLQDIDLVWWNCKKYNGQFDPIIAACERLQHELSLSLQQQGIEVGKGGQKRRRVSRGPTPMQETVSDAALGDNDGRLVGKSIMIFTELRKGKKEWLSVEVKAYDRKSKSYTVFWIGKGKTTKKATFGLDKMYPVYRIQNDCD